MTGGAMRIGLLADTHDEIVPWDVVHDRVASAFDGVELIVHCGDLTTMAVLDRLAELAPVIAVRSEGDPPPEPPRLVDGPRVVQVGGLTVAVVTALPERGLPEFDETPQVVVHGGTHVASIGTLDGVLLVNPGSPTLADTASVAVLTIDGGTPSARIIEL